MSNDILNKVDALLAVVAGAEPAQATYEDYDLKLPEASESLLRVADQCHVSPLDENNIKLINNVHPPDYVNPTPPQEPYDMIAIGAGAGGLCTVATSSRIGARAALIECNLMGGDCLNVGCVPSKALISAARVVYMATKRGKEFGLNVQNYSVDFGFIMERMRNIRASISKWDAQSRFAEMGIDVYIGRAEFVDGETIRVDDKLLKFKKACVATGASPWTPPIPGILDVPYLTNHTLFNLTRMPQKFGVIGAGPIGCEMAQSFAMFGSEVYLIDMADQILIRDDPDAAKRVQQEMVECGVNLVLSVKPTLVAKTSDGRIAVTVEQKNGASQKFVVDELLVSTGRRPNVEAIGLENAGIEYSKRGIQVNDLMQTTNPNIYAVGDVASKYQFTHVSGTQGHMVAVNALVNGRKLASKMRVPWCTYTDPEIAHVGATAAELKESGRDYEEYRTGFGDRGHCEGQKDPFCKVYFNPHSGHVYGATVVGADAGNIISEISTAMAGDLTLDQVNSVIHPYPTSAECFHFAGARFWREHVVPQYREQFEHSKSNM